MRRPSPNIGAFGRTLGFVVVAALIVALAVHLRRNDEPAPTPVPTPSTPSDPLAQELARCQAIGMAAENDVDCRAAWAENRRRFFASPPGDAPAANPPTDQKTPNRVEDR